MNIRGLVTVSALLALLLSAMCGAAQQQRRTNLGRPVPCPYPGKVVIHGHNPARVMATEVPASVAAAAAKSVFNQTQINKSFGYTFNFPVRPKDCCLWTIGYMTVKFKALQGGPKDSASSANDRVSIWVKGAVVVPSHKIWAGNVATNATRTATFAIPASALTHGHASLIVEAGTAVMSAELALEGCCLCSK